MKKTKSELMIEIEAAAEAGDFVREIELRGQWMVAPEAEQATEPSEQETAEAGFCPKCGYSLAGGKICSVCGWQEKRGGARPGAGRKPDSAKAQTREPLYQEGYNAGYRAGKREYLAFLKSMGFNSEEDYERAADQDWLDLSALNRLHKR